MSHEVCWYGQATVTEAFICTPTHVPLAIQLLLDVCFFLETTDGSYMGFAPTVFFHFLNIQEQWM
jgi:hypothetical protein